MGIKHELFVSSKRKSHNKKWFLKTIASPSLPAAEVLPLTSPIY